ncbi:MAG: aspartate aminotransferase family protein [Tepidimonas sp.]|uniref:aspartate aminotransferase family protein n=1 Tax=Tepidimonas sp. TaxID=2002775 RepID=UPI00298F11AB|nr:aspartate aminotransferase family protein [Tepidimonas sp.]MDW8335842.1 aspartate aminotransferase family protein [Tepidimonas sp.]
MTREPNAELTRELRTLDAAHLLHPFTDHAALAAKGVRVIARAEGIWIWDTEGHRILDGMSGLWCVNAGYGRRELAQAAYQQMLELPFYNTFFQTTTEPPVRLAQRLTALAPPVRGQPFTHVFFTSSGSEANDTNVRLVRRYWDLLGQPQRKVIISRCNAYHGSTVAAASLGGMSGMHEQGDLPIPGIVHIQQPYYWGLREPGETPEAFGLRAARWLEDKILEIGPQRVAAFIAEPVQGAGGVIIPPPTYWPEVQRIVQRYGILLISDEVICAFGRLGHWFAYEKFGIQPDLVTFAKAVTSGYVPLGGVLVHERVARVLVEGGEFTHGYTYSGHPVACAVALANLDLMQREALPERVRHDTGPYLAERWATLADHPLVGVTESCGFVAGLVLTRDKATLAPFPDAWEVGLLCRQHCFDSGVVMRAVGQRMIIAPPLTMTRADIDTMIERIVRALDATWADLQQRHGL